MSPEIQRAPRPRKWPVSEIFGPTIQGEGPDSGMPCYFVRFGGCDYDCSWCDTPYAVKPAEVRKLTRQGPADIVRELIRLREESHGDRLASAGDFGLGDKVILSGGNPLLHDLSPLTEMLIENRFLPSVETQGSRWQPWLKDCDKIIVSPKPPSSGMATLDHEAETRVFMERLTNLLVTGGGGRGSHFRDHSAVKIVCFDDEDYEWAIRFHQAYQAYPFYLSAGTDQDYADGASGAAGHAWTRDHILDRFSWLCEKVEADPRAKRAHVGLQMHVLAWGTGRGF